MKSWGNLGVVDTIYEEEYECSSPSLASSPSSPPPNFHSKNWTLANGCKTDVLIRVQGTCFLLHRDPLTSRSTYLKRQLTDHKELTLAPPLNITAETFSLVAEFCYGTRIAITPFNVAALRTAAELLQMTEANRDGDENLKQLTETFFRRIVTVNKEYALIVFRSSLPLLPEAETTAFIVSRCIEALSLTDEGYGVVEVFEEVVRLGAEDFKLVAESMNQRFTSHDVLYEIVDLYLQKNSSGEMTEEQKVEICDSIDCNKLSSGFLLHVVQNPRMPLRFMIRAMLAEQLHTRSSIFSTGKTNNNNNHHHHHNASEDPVTLGAILQRDEALREAVQLKAAMGATSLRIQSLENELDGMKKRLKETEKERSDLSELNNRLLHEKGRSILSSSTSAGKSASFHYGDDNKKIVGGERGSVSSLNVRDVGGRGRLLLLGTEASRNHDKMKKNIGRRLINGLKSAFRVSKQASPPDKQTNANSKLANSRRDEG
ncbi:hypothetical protein AB3S75_004261 [Citrus x aurantiifolia]